MSGSGLHGRETRASAVSVRRRAGFLVAVVGFVLALPGAAGAAYPGRNGDLVFQVDPNLPGCYGSCGESLPGPMLYRMRGDGTRLRRIFARKVAIDRFRIPVDFDGADPVWSPDGRRVAFVRRDFPVGPGGLVVPEDRLVVGTVGSGVVRTVLSLSDSRFPHRDSTLGRASWSPGGRRLVFELFDSSDGGAQFLFSVRDDGADLRRVVRLAPFPRFGATSLQPAWSSRNWISFTRDRPTTKAHKWNVWLVRPDGSGLHAVTRTGGRSAAWSPSGRTLAYDCGDGLCSLRPGGRRRVLVRHGHGPAWSPDGRQLALIGRKGIYVARADGSRPRLIKRTPASSDRVPGLASGLDWQPLPVR